jgi:hypothetical protein
MAVLPFQIVLWINSWWIWVYTILELGAMLYKGVLLPYPGSILAGEIIFIILYFFLQEIRFYFGRTNTFSSALT